MGRLPSFLLCCAMIFVACASPESDVGDAAEGTPPSTLAEFRQRAEARGALVACPGLTSELPGPVRYALPQDVGSILLPDSAVTRSELGGSIREWSLPSGAKISAWVSEEPEMALAATEGIRIEKDSECAMEVGAAFAHAALYRVIDGADTSFNAMVSTYPRVGLAILFDLEVPTAQGRNVFLSAVQHAQIAESTPDPS
jgi:hypothetical protein